MNTLKFYKDTLNKYGDDPKGVGWKSFESQQIRFKVLSEIGDLRGKSVLDVGCGLGDFYRYLIPLTTNYIGYDIVPEMVMVARRKYPGVNFFSEFPNEKFDFVFASGVFNLPEEHWVDKTFNMISDMFDHCNIGVGINFLSDYSKTKDNVSKYTNPSEILKFTSMLTGKWILRHDYKNNDWTIYLYK